MRVCGVQCTGADLINNIDQFNAIHTLKKYNIFDAISLVCPTGIDEDILREKAELWGVEYYAGDVNDVAKRFHSFTKNHSADIVTRVLPQWFFIEPQLVLRSIEYLETSQNCEVIRYPYNFDIRFGGDTCKASFFKRAADVHDKQNHNGPLFNPWSLAETHPDEFQSSMVEDTPVYEDEVFNNHKKIMKSMWPEHWNNSHMPCTPYKMAITQFYTIHSEKRPSKPKALDLACGDGSGSQHMATNGFSVNGVDIDEATISNCIQKYNHSDCAFTCADYKLLDIDNASIDLVVSIHTMEHVPDDHDFIDRIHRWLKPQGLLAIEVPILLAKPYLDITSPISPFHVKEYQYEKLIELLTIKFSIISSFGVNRGKYLSIDKMRNAALVICQKK